MNYRSKNEPEAFELTVAAYGLVRLEVEAPIKIFFRLREFTRQSSQSGLIFVAKKSAYTPISTMPISFANQIYQ